MSRITDALRRTEQEREAHLPPFGPRGQTHAIPEAVPEAPGSLAAEVRRQGQWLKHCAQRAAVMSVEIEAARQGWITQVETLWACQQLSHLSQVALRELDATHARLARIEEAASLVRGELAEYRRRSETLRRVAEHLQGSLAEAFVPRPARGETVRNTTMTNVEPHPARGGVTPCVLRDVDGVRRP